MSPRALEVVFVCTGNRFRSPLAEALLRARSVGLPLEVRSCGTLPDEGEPALAEAQQLARSYGVDLSLHRSRSLASERLASADLVIGFEATHLARAVIDAAAARERAFTLPELVQMLDRAEAPADGDALDRARALIGSLSGLERPRPTPEIDDPFGGSRRGYAEAAERIHQLVAALADRLFPPD
jgi:protein-tyrosine-phosphatase